MAPDVVEAIMDGRQAEGVTLPGLLCRPVPADWLAQPGAAEELTTRT
jgi:hypothetical protein